VYTKPEADIEMVFPFVSTSLFEAKGVSPKLINVPLLFMTVLPLVAPK
jgi:hypothetical protein